MIFYSGCCHFDSLMPDSVSQREDYPVARKDWSLLLVDHATQASIEGNGRISGQILQWTEQYATLKPCYGMELASHQACLAERFR